MPFLYASDHNSAMNIQPSLEGCIMCRLLATLSLCIWYFPMKRIDNTACAESFFLHTERRITKHSWYIVTED